MGTYKHTKCGRHLGPNITKELLMRAVCGHTNGIGIWCQRSLREGWLLNAIKHIHEQLAKASHLHQYKCQWRLGPKISIAFSLKWPLAAIQMFKAFGAKDNFKTVSVYITFFSQVKPGNTVLN